MGKNNLNLKLMKAVPNKYDLTPKRISKLKILDWPRLKQHTWYNLAKTDGNWWCHCEGCSLDGKYNDEDEFWIGFNERNNKIAYDFSSYGGMCGYEFEKFYDAADIENEYDMNVQINTLKWLNMMIDNKILGVK